jgi:hypothetical protein
MGEKLQREDGLARAKAAHQRGGAALRQSALGDLVEPASEALFWAVR